MSDNIRAPSATLEFSYEISMDQYKILWTLFTSKSELCQSNHYTGQS